MSEFFENDSTKYNFENTQLNNDSTEAQLVAFMKHIQNVLFLRHK